MKFVTELEGKKADILKTARAAIRLKHALLADAEIRRVLPELEEAMNLAIQTGEAFEYEPAKILAEIE